VYTVLVSLEHLQTAAAKIPETGGLVIASGHQLLTSGRQAEAANELGMPPDKVHVVPQRNSGKHILPRLLRPG
jgi:hypothetical protein